MNPIDEETTLHALSSQELFEKDVEFIAVLKAFDASSGPIVYSRSSYKASEIVWSEKFVYLAIQDNGKLPIDVCRIKKSETAQ